MAGLGQQLLSEARALVTRLHDQDKLSDTLLAQSQTLNERINCMKEYQEDLHELNEVCHQRPRSALVHSLQQENRQIRMLQEENRQLKLALEEHQAALDLIMLRYRQQVLQMVQMNWVHKMAEKSVEAAKADCSGEDLSKMVEFGHVFGTCLKLGEDSSLKDQEELSRLQAENRTLRQLLKIAAPNDQQAVKAYGQFVRSQQSVVEEQKRQLQESIDEEENGDSSSDDSQRGDDRADSGKREEEDDGSMVSLVIEVESIERSSSGDQISTNGAGVSIDQQSPVVQKSSAATPDRKSAIYKPSAASPKSPIQSPIESKSPSQKSATPNSPDQKPSIQRTPDSKAIDQRSTTTSPKSVGQNSPIAQKSPVVQSPSSKSPAPKSTDPKSPADHISPAQKSTIHKSTDSKSSDPKSPESKSLAHKSPISKSMDQKSSPSLSNQQKSTTPDRKSMNVSSSSASSPLSTSKSPSISSN